MLNFISSCALVVVVGNLTVSGQVQRTTAAYQTQRLGSDAIIALPTSLSDLVRQSSAAVVAVVTEVEPLDIREATSLGGTRLGSRALEPYRVQIKEVLFNRLAATAPPLIVGQAIRVTQAVRSEDPRTFDADKRRVAPGEECVLMLWHRGGAEDWSLAPWQGQFRRSRQHDGGAEAMSPEKSARWLRGSSLAVHGSEDAPYVSWDALRAEIKRLTRTDNEQ